MRLSIKKAKIFGGVFGTLLFVLLVAGLTYAWVTWRSPDIPIAGDTKCFDIDYTKGGNIEGASVILFDENDIINNDTITIKEGMAVTNVGAKINNSCDVVATMLLYLNVNSLNEAFVSGNSVNSFKYAVAEYSKTDYPDISIANLKDNTFNIVATDAINQTGSQYVYKTELSKDTSKDYLIIFYIDGDLANNDAGNTTFNANIEAKVVQGNNVEVSDHTIRVHYIDVGQADSIFVELPNNETLLIDAGMPVNDYESHYARSYITGLGYDTIDYVVVTHPDYDHIGGMAGIVNDFNIGTLYMPNLPVYCAPTDEICKSTNSRYTTNDDFAASATFTRLLDAIDNKNMTITTAKAGDSILQQDDLSIDILFPPLYYTNYSTANNFSVIVKITFGTAKFLFMGDAETAVETALLEDATVDLSANVVKVGHHGSSSSSSENFVNAVNADYAIISVGQNSYGHPNQTILERWENSNASVLRTDQHGTIMVASDGNLINAVLSR